MRFLKTSIPFAFALSFGTSAAAETTLADHSSTPTQWLAKPWGEVGLLQLAAAPYPDDTRTTGFESKNGRFDYKDHYDDPTVVVAIPTGFKPAATVDVILHFHGWSNEAAKALDAYHFGEQLQASGKNAIVILPQGPKNSKDSGIGKIAKPGGMKQLIDEALDVLSRDGKLTTPTTLRNIVLSGHSGAYFAMGQCLDVGGYQDKVTDLWIWDAAYGQWPQFARWAAARPPAAMRLRSIFTDHLVNSNLRIMSLLSLSGIRFVTLHEDDLVSTASEKQDAFIYRGAKSGSYQLPAILHQEPVVFLHTRLVHDRVMDEKNYFQIFCQDTPSLEPRP